MDLAKPGLIKAHCYPNAVFTFAEYLEDFADDNLKRKGYELINRTLPENVIDLKKREAVLKNVEEIKNGKRDIYY
jgi:2-iminoacetate synthase